MRIIATALATLTLSMALAGPVSAASGHMPSGLAVGSSNSDPISDLLGGLLDGGSNLNSSVVGLLGDPAIDALGGLTAGLSGLTGGLPTSAS